MLETDVFLVKKPVIKLDTNKHFSCIYIFADTLYLGNYFIMKEHVAQSFIYINWNPIILTTTSLP